MSIAIVITIVICGFFGFSMGKTSNGMTSPREAFNIWIPIFSAIAGGIIGLFGSAILLGALAGLASGSVGLILARTLRGQ